MPFKIKKVKNSRWPTLETLLMIEQTITKSNRPLTRRELWLNLPKKVMWQTFLVALDYLEKIGRISRESGKLVCKGDIQKYEINTKYIPSYVG